MDSEQANGIIKEMLQNAVNLNHELFLESHSRQLTPDEQMIYEYSKKLSEELLELRDEIRCLKPFSFIADIK